MTDFNLTFAGARGESPADLARRLGLAPATASDTEALMAVLNRTVSVAAASTGNVSVSSAPSAIDGLTLGSGDRVLLHAQTAPAENGVYVFASAGAALTRWSGANEWHELPGLRVGVSGGSTHANTAWTCFSAHSGTLGTTAISFLKLAGSLNALLSLVNVWSAVNAFTATLLVGTADGSYGSALAVDKASVSLQAAFGPHSNGGVAYNTGDRRVEVSAWTGTPSIKFLRYLVNSLEIGVASDGSGTWSDGVGERMRLSDGVLIVGGTGSLSTAGYGTIAASGAAGGQLLLRADGATSFEVLGRTDSVTLRSPLAVPMDFHTSNTGRLRITAASGHVEPLSDNSQNLGSGSARFATVYAGTGTINTSDATEKSAFTAIPDGVKAAARTLMGQIGVFQWLEAIDRKGEAGARFHLGVKAQDVRHAFLAEGEDPNRWGLFCEDAILAPVERSRSVQRQVTREVQRPRETIEIIAGKAVLDRVQEVVVEPVFEAFPLVDAAGQAVLRAVVTAGPDGEPVTSLEPAMHMVPVMEWVEEASTEMEPTGATRLGLRHDQLMMLFLAVLAGDPG